MIPRWTCCIKRLVGILAVCGSLAVRPAGEMIDRAAFEAACAKALGAKRGAVIVLSLQDGRVLCEHDRRMAARRFYGSSIYKPLAAYALLKEGVLKPQEKLLTSRQVLVERYGVTLQSRYEEDGAEVDLARAIAVSSNSYFYRMGARLDPEVFLKYYRDFGLGACVRAPKTNEEKAEFPAHGGRCVSASSVDLIPYLRKLALDPSPEMAIVRAAMRLAVTDGTAKGADVEGFGVCGKTGWLNGAGLFIAFWPQEKPALGIIVAVPGATGSEAATVAGEVLKSLNPRAR